MIEVKTHLGTTELKTEGPKSVIVADLICIIASVKDILPEEKLPLFRKHLQTVVADDGPLWMTEEQREKKLRENLEGAISSMLKKMFAPAQPSVKNEAKKSVDEDPITIAVRRAMENMKGTAADESGT